MKIRVLLLFAIVHFIWIDGSAGLPAQNDTKSNVEKQYFYLFDINETTTFELFMNAIRNNDIDSVQKIIIGVNGFTTDELSSALRLATQEGYEKIAHLLIENGAHVNPKKVRPSVESFFDAVREDDIGSIREIVKGFSKHMLNAALGQVAYKGKDQIVEVLIKAGADANYKDEITHNMALSDAVVGGHEKSVEILLDNGADMNAGFAHDNHTALHSAVAWDKQNIVDLLIRRGANVNAVDSESYTPLHFAASTDNLKAIESLIKAGANINSINYKNETPLFRAVENGFAKTVELLLKNGADRSISNKNGKTPLNLAEKMFSKSNQEDYKQIVDMLKAK